MSTKEIYGVIYLIRNEVNGKVYIGQTIQKGGFDERYKNNVAKYTKNEHLRRSINKYGIDNFYIDKEFDVAYSQEELDKLEDLYIKTYETTNPNKGYNKKFGGSSGKHTEETRKKLSLNNGSRRPEVREKISKSNKGKTLSNEHKKKISEARKGRKHTEETKEKLRKLNLAENAPMYGKTHTEETRRKLSEAKSGKNHHMYGKNHKEETKKKIALSKNKKVICITTGLVFNSVTEASNFYSCSRTHIGSCCTGKRKTCGKHPITNEPLKWAYYEYYLLEINQAS